jgi:cysteinyl-tRNA synthetase
LREQELTMGLRIYNTLTREKQEFQTVHPGKVGMYVCGVTVYDMCHIGHARSVVLFDVIFRYLLHRGYQVTYVRNFTDVDDKIINRANDVGEHWKSLAERFIQEFYVDMDALGVLRPTVEPKATEHIAQIQALIGDLIAKGFAYEVEGDVMYAVNSFDEYGKLSGKKTDELISGARVGVDEKKRNPLDFALWKAAKPGEPFWDSPWGPGRPGWHIECSAMSMQYLGKELDIHGGGADLAFPHHENEIAQSEASTGKPFARYWIHNGFVNIRAEKMSKSLGNVLNIREILQRVHAEALRLFLLSSHYRSPLDYNETSIREASVGLERLYAALAALDDLLEANGKAKDLPEELKDIKARFFDAMDDDFNTPRTLAVLFDAARAINRMAMPGAPKKSIVSPELLQGVKTDISEIAKDVLGLLKDDPAVFLDTVRKARIRELGITEDEVQSMIDARAQARKDKDFGLADKIRNELADKGILLEDGPRGTTWRVKES